MSPIVPEIAANGGALVVEEVRASANVASDGPKDTGQDGPHDPRSAALLRTAVG